MIKTRSGRLIKKPDAVYVPDLTDLIDDYAPDEYDSSGEDENDSDIATDDELCETDDEPEEEVDDADADEDGNLKDFVCDDEEEEYETDEYETDDESYYETESDTEESDTETEVAAEILTDMKQPRLKGKPRM